MSRGRLRSGGAGKGRTKKNAGPETTWEPEPLAESSTNEPEPLFPDILQSLPVTLSRTENDRVNHYRHFRDLVRDGPLYTVLGPGQQFDKDGKLSKRATFDPFEDLRFFPKELWHVMDPQRRDPAWGPLTSDTPQNTRLKRKPTLTTTAIGSSKRIRIGIDREDTVVEHNEGDKSDQNDDLGSALRSTTQNSKRQKASGAQKNAKQKKGLDAEDDYGVDPDQAEDEDHEGQEIAEDSSFEESDDGAGDDYNAEAYFDAGDDDNLDEGGAGGDDEGGTFMG